MVVLKQLTGTARYFFTRNGTEQERQFKKLSGTERNMFRSFYIPDPNPNLNPFGWTLYVEYVGIRNFGGVRLDLWLGFYSGGPTASACIKPNPSCSRRSPPSSLSKLTGTLTLICSGGIYIFN